MRITLKAARINSGLNQKEASKQIGISDKTLSFYENGKTFPSIKTIKQIEKVYQISYNDIIFLR